MTQSNFVVARDRLYIMGVINLSAESFASEGRCLSLDDALFHAEKLIGEGADILDIGAEPTNPKLSSPVTDPTTQLRYLTPVIEGIRQRFDTPLSVDTSEPEVMQSVVSSGATLINDIRALRRPGALEAVAKLGVSVCLMHMQYPDGPPESGLPARPGVVEEVKTFLEERIDAAMQAGIKKDRIIIDPGFGAGSFGKGTRENLLLMNQLETFTRMGYPLLAGLSRKTFIGDLLKCPEQDRVFGSLTMNIFAVLKGANIVRTHDVRAMRDALTLMQALEECAA